MHPPSPLPRELRGRAFSVADALRQGVSPRRLRASDLVRPYRGLRIPGDAPRDLVTLASAFTARLGDGIAFSHDTAAMLWGAPMPLDTPTVPLHVTRRSGVRAPDADGLVGHVLSPSLFRALPVDVPDGAGELVRLPVVAVDVMLAGLASRLTLDDLVPVIDWAIARWNPRLEPQDILELVERWGRRPGSARLRDAAPMARTGSRARTESQKRMLVVAAGLPEPQLNVPIFDARGRLIGEGDTVWPDYFTVSEYEGDWHRTDRRKFRSDIERFERYVDAGWSPVRSTADDLYVDPNPYLRRLATRLAANGCPVDPDSLPRLRPFRR